MNKRLFSAALAVASAFTGFFCDSVVAQTSTAQSQMVKLNLGGGGNSSTYFIRGTTEWSFDDLIAGTPASRLVNTSATFTSRSCSGGGSNTGQPCNSANAPATPTPTDAEIIAALTSGGGANWSNAEKTTFYCGGTITRTGTLQLSRPGLNGSGTWKFNYNISASTNALDPETAWSSVTTSNGIDINCNGFVAGESVLVQSKKLKYSFSMLTTDPLTGLPASRATDTTAYLELQDPVTLAWAVVDQQLVDTSEVKSTTTEPVLDADGNPVLDSNGNIVTQEVPYDFVFYGNAGQTGKSGAIGYLHAPGRLPADYAGLIMDNDTFAGNNGTYPERAVMQPFKFTIDSTPGTYRVRLVGTIKGNVGTVDAGFNVSTSFNVIGDPNCN